MKRTAMLLALAVSVTGPAFSQLGKLKQMVHVSKKDGDSTKEKSGGNPFQKLVGKMAKGAGALSGTTRTAEHLSEFDPTGYVLSDIYGKEVGTLETDMVKGWAKGSDVTSIMLMPKNRLFFYKLNGGVKMDGKPMDYLASGVYTQVTPTSQQTRLLELETADGEKARFKLAPSSSHVKIKSINGMQQDAVVDMSKDITIELSGYSPSQLVKLKIVAQLIGLRGVYEVMSFKPAAKIVIPGYALRHLNSENKGMNFKNSYFIIDQGEGKEATDELGKYKQPMHYLVGSTDAMSIKVVNEEPLLQPLKLEREEKMGSRKFTSVIVRPNASGSRPLKQATVIAPLTSSFVGTTYFYDYHESKFMNERTEKTYKFPQMNDALLTNISTEMYQKVTDVLKQTLNASIIEPSKVTSTAAYAEIENYSMGDDNTTEHFNKAYEGLHQFPMQVPLAMIMQGEPAMIRATGANALLKMTLNMQLSWDKDPRMTPILTVELKGDKNGGDLGLLLTNYFKITVTGEGYKLKMKQEVTPEMVREILSIDTLAAMLRKSIEELKAREQEAQYEKLWSYQN